MLFEAALKRDLYPENGGIFVSILDDVFNPQAYKGQEPTRVEIVDYLTSLAAEAIDNSIDEDWDIH